MTMINESIKWTKEATIDWVDTKVDSFIRNYQENGVNERINIRELCSQWQWAKRSDVYTHYFHRYPAKLLPYIPIFFLSGSLALTGSVLDPFSGTGTVAVESIVHFVHPKDCNIIEINPLARLISAAKTTPIDPEVLRIKFKELLLVIKKLNSNKLNLPDFPGLDFWFRKKAIIELAIIRDAIMLLECGIEVRDFFLVCFSAIIRDMSRADPDVSPPVLLSADKFRTSYKSEVQKKIRKKNSYNALSLFESAVSRNIARMQSFWSVWQKYGKQSKVIGYDARSLTRSPYLGCGILDVSKETKLPKNSIGMVITSPPYINAQKYTRTTKLELWWLGLIEATSDALVEYDQNLIGTESVNFNEYAHIESTHNSSADNFIDRVYLINKKKAGIIYKYFNDMRLALKEIYRVLKPGGYCVLVIGNNLVYKQQIQNNEILAEMANDEGLVSKAMLVDEIRSRGLFTKRNDTAGMIADEWILLLQKPLKDS